MTTMINTISLVGVIYWRYSLSVIHGRSLRKHAVSTNPGSIELICPEI